MPDQDPSDSPHIRASLRSNLGTFSLDVDLDIPGRGTTALFGPSGSGKTTCLRAIAGLERARGVVRVGRETWQDDDRGVFVPTHRRGIGYVSQDAGLFPHLTVRGNLEYGRKRSRSAKAIDETSDAVIALLGVGNLLERRPDFLSGGERQRVAIARALLAGPRLLLMDEPLASLDLGRKAELLPYLERLRDDAIVPIVYVSHALDEVWRLANQLVLLDGGRVLASGPTNDILSRLDLPTSLFEDAGVVLEGRVAAHDETDQLTRLELGGVCLWVGRVNRPSGSSARVRVLARDVSLARDPPRASSILNVLTARIEQLKDDGPDRVIVRLAIGDPGLPMLARITRRSRDALALHPGLEVHALVKSVALVA